MSQQTKNENKFNMGLFFRYFLGSEKSEEEVLGEAAKQNPSYKELIQSQARQEAILQSLVSKRKEGNQKIEKIPRRNQSPRIKSAKFNVKGKESQRDEER